MRRILKFLSISKEDFTKLIVVFALWRTLLFGVGLISDQFLKYAPSFPYVDSLLETSNLPKSIYSWAGFDGVHYLTIALTGYKEVQFIQAFFPLLPAILLRPIHLLFANQINLVAASLFIVQLFALTSIVTWFALINKTVGKKQAWISILVLLLFPTSLFLGALYTEGLFLTLVFLSFFTAQKRYWLAAGILAALASATRIIGIFLVPALLLELYLYRNSGKLIFSVEKIRGFLNNEKRNIAFILSGCVGLLAYMLYLHLAVNDALAFFHVQSAFGAGRQTSLVIYPQVVFRSFKILITNAVNLKYFAYTQEFIAGTLGLLAIILGAKYSRSGWVLFSLCAFFLPPLTGTFSSMSRYIFVCFPIFIFLAKIQEKHPKLFLLWLIISTAILLANTVLFLQGYWVA